jgi:hypothetical protein
VTTEHRKAPRRKVLDISRVGAWGDIQYLHKLECGHTEARPRATRSPKLACAWCLRAEAKDAELRALAPAVDDTIVDVDANQEEVVARETQALIAARFGIPNDAVSLSMEFRAGRLVVTHAVVFLEAGDVRRLANK